MNISFNIRLLLYCILFTVCIFSAAVLFSGVWAFLSGIPIGVMLMMLGKHFVFVKEWN